MRLLNVFEWYRDQRLPDEEPDEIALGLGGELPQIDEVTHTVDVAHPDGGVHRTEHYRDELEVAHDYRRADGTVFLRKPAGPAADKFPVTPYVLVGHDGRPVRAWRRVTGWHWHWLRWLAGDAERVFLVTDSRFALGNILPRMDDRFFLLHLIHNNHTVGDRRWDSTLSPDYEPLFRRMRMVDGLVTLTERQSEDVAQRFGRSTTSSWCPIRSSCRSCRDHAGAGAGGLRDRVPAGGQKRLQHAIEAFALVVAKRPEATPADLRQRQAAAGPAAAGHRRARRGRQGPADGHDRHAKHELLRATGFLMTSVNEGYPLATLESMAFGCPVVSYDIKYGPRDQITDGVDGFIVPAGDVEAVAERCVQMIDSPGPGRRPLAQRRPEGRRPRLARVPPGLDARLRDGRVAASRPGTTGRSRAGRARARLGRAGGCVPTASRPPPARGAGARGLGDHRAGGAGLLGHAADRGALAQGCPEDQDGRARRGLSGDRARWWPFRYARSRAGVASSG